MQNLEQVKSLAIKAGGGQHKVACPFCSGTRKKKNDPCMSLHVSDDGAKFNCFHCGESGAVRISDDWVDLPPRKYNQQNFGDVRVLNELSEGAVLFLEGRGISQETAERAGLGSYRTYYQALGRETDSVAFPYFGRDGAYAWKIRSVEEKAFSAKGAAKTFFNLRNVVKGEPLIICEGEMDALSLMEVGYSAVSVPKGAYQKNPTNDNDPWFDFLFDAEEFLSGADRIIIATDSDEAGVKTAEEIARRVGKDKCYRVEWPEGCKDANDVLVKIGSEDLCDVIESAKLWPVNGLYDADHYSDLVDQIYQDGMGSGASTGYQSVDDLYTIVCGQLTVATGVPSSGKSEFIDQLMVNLAEREGWRFAICSFENDPRLHIAKLISKHIKKPFFEGQPTRMSEAEKDKGKKFVQSHFFFMHQSDGSMSDIDSIIERLRISVLRYGIRGCVIDPYNYIQKRSDISETDWISDMLTKIRVFAQAHGIHVWFVAHPTKMMRGHDGVVPVPKGYDISGSAAWFAKADIGLTVHRPEPSNNISEVHIWKCRFSWVGKVGFTELLYDRISSNYNELFSGGPNYSALQQNPTSSNDLPF